VKGVCFIRAVTQKQWDLVWVNIPPKLRRFTDSMPELGTALRIGSTLIWVDPYLSPDHINPDVMMLVDAIEAALEPWEPICGAVKP
jgi:hypothetical protein